MKILIHGINFSPELTGIGKYSGELARWLAAKGNDVRVITAPPYYPDWKVHEGFYNYAYKMEFDEGVKVVRCPLYVPSEPSSIKRILHLVSFFMSSFVPVVGQVKWKPDLVVLVAPTLFCSPQVQLLAKLSKAKTLLHIQDYEVDVLFGLSAFKNNLIQRFAFSIERLVLRSFDNVSTISSHMLKRARQKGVDENKLIFFPNWSEVALFEGAQRSNELLSRLGISPGKRVLLYSGNIGEKQGLEILIKCAEHYEANENLVFLIIGDGAGKKKLSDKASQSGVRNMIFAPLQPYEDLPQLLASADCHLVIQKRAAADAVLPSKLTNILSVGGNAVITADEDSSLGELCERYPGIAVCVEPESVNALIEGIEKALAMPRLNLVAKEYAAAHLEKENILSQFLSEVQ